MKKRLAIMAAGATLALSAGAQAATLNFADEALPANGGERGLVNGAIFTSSNGISVRLTSGGVATDGSDKVPAPYLDDTFQGRPAGLGVCTLISGPGSECERSNEDNTTGDQDEFIELGFLNDTGERLMSLRSISFRDKNHFDISDSSDLIRVSVNGAAASTMTFSEVVAAATSGLYADAETLRLIGVALVDGGREFYLNAISDVPIPGALPLLLSGVAGLGFAARRKKAAA